MEENKNFASLENLDITGTPIYKNFNKKIKALHKKLVWTTCKSAAFNHDITKKIKNLVIPLRGSAKIRYKYSLRRRRIEYNYWFRKQIYQVTLHNAFKAL